MLINNKATASVHPLNYMTTVLWNWEFSEIFQTWKRQ